MKKKSRKQRVEEGEDGGEGRKHSHQQLRTDGDEGRDGDEGTDGTEPSRAGDKLRSAALAPADLKDGLRILVLQVLLGRKHGPKRIQTKNTKDKEVIDFYI